MKKIMSAFVLALVMVAFVGCEKKTVVPVEKKDIKTLEEKAGDQAKKALEGAPAAPKAPAVPEKPKDHPEHPADDV